MVSAISASSRLVADSRRSRTEAEWNQLELVTEP